MNALIIYDSQFGNTEKVANSIAETLSEHGQVKAIHVSKADSPALDGVSLLVIGSPTQGWRATPAIRSFIEKLPDLKSVPAAAFDTRFKRTRLLTGSAAHGIAKALRKKGAQLAVPPESFFVKDTKGPLLDGEIGRVTDWAKLILR